MRYFQWLVICLSLSLLALTGFLSVLRQKQSTAEWIAFLSNRSGDWHVYVMSPDGENIRQITHENLVHSDTYPGSVRWRGLTTELDFLAVNTMSKYTHHFIEFRTTQRHEYDYLFNYLVPLSWSTDGQWVAYADAMPDTGQFWIYRMHPDGSAKSAVTNIGYNQTSPAFSPDARWIVYPVVHEGQFALAKIRVDGTDFQILVRGLSTISTPQWSPDGKWIAFSAYHGVSDDIYIVRPDGTQLTNLTLDSKVNQTMPTWSPDSKWIAYTASDLGVAKLFKISIDGLKVEPLAVSSAEERSPAWSPRFDRSWHGMALAGAGLIGLGVGFGLRQRHSFKKI